MTKSSRYVNALKKAISEYERLGHGSLPAFDSLVGSRGLRGRDDDLDEFDEEKIAEVLRENFPPEVCNRLLAMLAAASPETTEGENNAEEYDADTGAKLEYGDRRRAKDRMMRTGAMDSGVSQSAMRGFQSRFPGAVRP